MFRVDGRAVWRYFCFLDGGLGGRVVGFGVALAFWVEVLVWIFCIV